MKTMIVFFCFLNYLEGGFYMRSAKETDCFPYTNKKLCYIEVGKDGSVLDIPHKNKSDRSYVSESYRRALSGESAIYAVWPGDWSSDLFMIDDLDAFAKAFQLY